MNEEEKKAIEILNTFELRRKTKNYKEISSEDSKSVKIVLNLIEKLQKENKELRKKLDEENKRCMMLAIEKQDCFEKYRYHLQQNESLTKEFSNVIPIQKVKDKIEELKNNPLKIKQNDKYYFETHAYNKIIISVLQELIEESEEK